MKGRNDGRFSGTTGMPMLKPSNEVEAVPMPDPRPEGAADWFRNLTGAEYPARQSLTGLYPVRRNVWASYVQPDTRIEGLPHFLSVRPRPEPPAPLRVLGFAGRGINRQALYCSIVDARNDIRLRLRFGGVLMDPVEGRDSLIADLRLVEWLHARSWLVPIHCTLRFGLGDREIRIVTAGGRRRKLYECFEPRLGFRPQAALEALDRLLAV
jgi:hypothetical protein